MPVAVDLHMTCQAQFTAMRVTSCFPRHTPLLEARGLVKDWLAAAMRAVESEVFDSFKGAPAREVAVTCRDMPARLFTSGPRHVVAAFATLA
jgi:hypothetical protein